VHTQDDDLVDIVLERVLKMGAGVLGAKVDKDAEGDAQGSVNRQQVWWVWTRGVEQGFTGDGQKSEAGKQRCTVTNRDEAGVSWSRRQQLSARAGLQIHVKTSCTQGSWLHHIS